jgi:hypothetical protein
MGLPISIVFIFTGWLLHDQSYISAYQLLNYLKTKAVIKHELKLLGKMPQRDEWMAGMVCLV